VKLAREKVSFIPRRPMVMSISDAVEMIIEEKQAASHVLITI
jgi:hypothetical protein